MSARPCLPRCFISPKRPKLKDSLYCIVIFRCACTIVACTSKKRGICAPQGSWPTEKYFGQNKLQKKLHNARQRK